MAGNPAQMTITKVVDGTRTTVLHVYVQGDGSGDLVNATLADPATLTPPVLQKPCFSILEIDNELITFDVRLSFDSVPDKPVWTLASASSNNTVNFHHMGGLIDRGGLDGTGKLLISTKGLENGDHGAFIITLRKRTQ